MQQRRPVGFYIVEALTLTNLIRLIALRRRRQDILCGDA
jgi:hypothetical protein